MKIINPWNTFDFEDHIFINFGSPGQLTYPLPNDIDTVVELELLEE